MEKYPFPKLKIAFNTGYGYQPVDIKFNNNTIKLPKGIFYIEHQVESVQDIIEIEFLNFCPTRLFAVSISKYFPQRRKKGH